MPPKKTGTKKSVSKSKSKPKPKPKTTRRKKSSTSRSRSSRSDEFDFLYSDDYGRSGDFDFSLDECRPGYERGLTGKCQKIPCYDMFGNYIHSSIRNKYGECEIPGCSSGKVRNPDTGKCISNKSETGRYLRSIERADRDIQRGELASRLIGLDGGLGFAGFGPPVYGPQNRVLTAQEQHANAQEKAKELREKREARVLEYKNRENEMREYRRKIEEVELKHRLRLQNVGGSLFQPKPAVPQVSTRVAEASARAAQRAREAAARRGPMNNPSRATNPAVEERPSAARSVFSFLNPFG